jgi:SOS response associated peptidase (SRAP)
MGAGQSEPLWTFTIVTTAASSSFSWLHDRQPVILNSQDALDRWLDTSTQTWDPKLSRLLDPYNDSHAPLEWCVPQFQFPPPIQYIQPSHSLSCSCKRICAYAIDDS